MYEGTSFTQEYMAKEIDLDGEEEGADTILREIFEMKTTEMDPNISLLGDKKS